MRIVLGGLARKCGKTTLACRILTLAPERNWTAVKISHHAPEPGAEFTLAEEFAPGGQGDTRRRSQEGAQGDPAMAPATTSAETANRGSAGQLVTDAHGSPISATRAGAAAGATRGPSS